MFWLTKKSPDLKLDGVVSGKSDGLLSPRRVSAIYEEKTAQKTTATTTIRLLACASGFGLLTSAMMTAVLCVREGQISLFEFTIITTNALVGIFALFLESNLQFFQSIRSTITHNVPSCGHVTWRGGFYTIAGLLNFAILQPLHLVVGVFSTAVGVYMIKVGYAAGVLLVKLRASITNEDALLKAFMSHDENGDGFLQQEEFDSLMLSLGMELDRDELDAIFYHIDVDNDKNIVYDEFRSWWKQATAEAKASLS